MTASRTMLAWGELTRGQKAGLQVAASESGYSLVVARTRAEATRSLKGDDEQGPPEAVLVQMEMGELQSLALETRAEAARTQLPILALTRELGDLSFEDAFSWGADDVLPFGNARTLIGAFRALPRDATGAPEQSRGTALVAEPDRTRRIVVGRVLRNAGYGVTFANSQEDLRSFARKGPELVVASDELEPDPLDAIDAARDSGVSPCWLVQTAPRRFSDRRRQLACEPRARAMDGFAPPENVLFMANELRRAEVFSRRQSHRLLYGTTVAFRPAGRASDEHGFSYNVSETGLYVRTILPPAEDTVWLELCPPRSERRVRLVGEVAWRRPFTASQHATVPPGFGVKIVDGAAADLAAWRHGYRAFVGALGLTLPPSA